MLDVLALTVPAEVTILLVAEPIAPEPELRFNVVAANTVPAACVIAPEPPAETTREPLAVAFAPMLIAPLLADVVCKVRLLAETAPDVVMVAEFITDSWLDTEDWLMVTG